MTNPRDTGRYDAFTDSYVDTNVRVDFAWGNIPMQPNDDRGMAQLDPDADSHIIAVTQYEGFPAFTTGEPFDDTIENTEVPNLVGLDSAAVDVALENADLSGSSSTTNTGANSGNDGTVKSQAPAAGTIVNVGSTVNYVTYDYVAPTTGPISAIRYNAGATAGDYDMFLIGQTVKPTVGWSINIAGNGNTAFNGNWEVMSVVNDNAYNTGGTKVVIRNVTITSQTEGVGGTWTKNV